MQTIYILISVYFICNAFFVGHNYDPITREVIDKDIFASKVGAYFALLVIFLFGLLFLFIEELLHILKSIDDLICFRFFFFFFFTKKYNDMKEENLVAINKLAMTKTSSSLKDLMFRFCIRLVNKRNHFIYK